MQVWKDLQRGLGAKGAKIAVAEQRGGEYN